MDTKAGKAVLGSCVAVAVVGLGIYLVARAGGAGAAAQALPAAVGKFRLGVALGEERAGFSGRAVLQVFAHGASADWSAVQACLISAEVEAALDPFVPILVDELAEPDVEAGVRAANGFSVVVRRLDGKFLGGLPAGFRCAEFVDLLRRVTSEEVVPPEKSPIYAVLLETAAPIDNLVQRGERGRAAKFVDFLREFEGAASPAVTAAESRLGQ